MGIQYFGSSGANGIPLMPIQSFFRRIHAMRQSLLRQHYQPKPDRVPEWLRRIWLWF
jgi:hypothetical protein